MALPQGFEELPDQPGAVGVRAGGPIIWLLLLLGGAGLVGGVVMCFVPAKESATTDTLWPVGAVFGALGVICLVTWFAVTRGPKFVLDDVGVHSRAVFGRYSVHWDHLEKVQPVRGAVFLTAPGGIYTGKGKLTRKKSLRFNLGGLKSGASGFLRYLTDRARNGGKAV